MALSSKERNKMIFAVLLLGLAVFALYRAFSAPSAPRPAAPAQPKTGQAKTLAIENPKLPTAQRRGGVRGAAKAPAGPIDPKLQLEHLARSANVSYETAGGRNIFAYAAPPPPPPPKPLPAPPPSPFPPGPSDRSGGSMAPQIAIPLKYFGFVQKPGDPAKRGFFWLDDELFIAGAGELVKKRYRILRFGVNIVEVEDTVAKSRQVLPQEAPAP